MADMEYAEIFREEAVELLEELETSLLELENNPDDMQIVSRVFRAMHTIKGSGSMFGFDDIAAFTHHVETALDKVREGLVPVSSELIDLTLASRDHISAMLDMALGQGEADEEEGRRIINQLQNILGAGEELPQDSGVDAPPTVTIAEDGTEDSLGPETHYRIQLRPSAAFFEAGSTVEQLIADLEKLGNCTVFVHGDRDQEISAGQWEFLLTSNQGLDAIEDVLIFVRPSCEVEVSVLATEEGEEFQDYKRLGEILVDRGDISAADLFQVLEKQRPIGELLVAEKLVAPSQVKAALVEQKMVNSGQGVKAAKAVDSIRVAADKLDHLINLVGELVVTQAQLTEISSRSAANAEIVEPVEEVERLTGELRDCVLNIRMLPIGTTFSRFKRLVRDLSAELGKEVTLVTSGADTELDKNVIDQLGEPLVHLIRNSMDHGLESPEQREEAGKARQGTIHLKASHAGANVVISVTDDGRGLDRDALYQKAVAKGIFRAEDEVSDADIFNTIFLPGLSTAAAVTSVSGRGVGMDVVKSTVDGLKGNVCVAHSEPGQGTTLSITLPLTLAIIDGLLVVVGDTHFVLPLSQVEECVELRQEDIAHQHERRVLPVREKLVPYVRLRDFFAIPGARPDLEQMVIVVINGERFGLVLDDVVGEHQTVLKSLGWLYQNAIGLSGSTILGNGEVALILDVPDVMGRAQQEEFASSS